MEIHFSENHLDKKTAILKLLKSFGQVGEKVGKGDRNVIKVFKVGNIDVNIKSFKIPNLINRVAYRHFRKSKAERSFTYAQKLLSNGIGTPEPIAYLEEKNSFVLSKSYYISEHLNADLTYRELIRDPNYPDFENILRQFTCFTHKLHENGILFKDHSPGNTLIKKNGENYNFYLVDLNRMEFKELNFKERVLNFTKLTSQKHMVEIMSDEYAKITPWSFDEIFKLMWGETSKFQKKFYRKKRLKEKYLFWKN